VLGNSHQLIEENNVSINLDPLPVIIADESQMIQLFQNLLSNAIKFNENKSPLVQVSAEVLKTEWRFSVQDNGIGIEPKDLGRLFIIFQRLHKRDKYPGRGLGLAICKKIVQRHGGRIWVESEPGKGARFYISIPRDEFSDYTSY
jgi:chemotaxis family two-component system sensor kinase Cph1